MDFIAPQRTQRTQRKEENRQVGRGLPHQWLIAVIALVPAAVKASIVDAVKQVISPPK